MDQRISTTSYTNHPQLTMSSTRYTYYTDPSLRSQIIPPPTIQHQIHIPYEPQHLPSYVTRSPPRVVQLQSTFRDPDEVRTLFIAGLPEDVMPREVYNLFRGFRGYESSHLRPTTKTSQPFAFAVFIDQACAVAALQSLNGFVFDIEKGSTLHIDLAKENSRSKRSRADDERGSTKRTRRPRPSTTRSLSPENGVGSTHSPGMSNFAPNTTGYPPAQSRESSPDEEPKNKHNFKVASNAHGHQENLPCPTLFVANLGPRCTEAELIQVFSRCSGFLKLKMQRRPGAPVAFVDFQDNDSSAAAINELQGTVLDSSVHEEGMRLEFAKSRMGTSKRK